MSQRAKIQKTCRSCHGKTLTTILSLGNIYLSEFRTNARKPAAYPLTLVLCSHCHLLQLKHTVPQSMLYTDNYGYRSGMNQTMSTELKEIVEKAQKTVENKKGKMVVLDIGANDGTLLKNYPSSVTRVGIEPIKKLAKEAKKHADIVINDFFTYQTYKKYLGNKKANIITAISCFYDMDDPNVFLSDITKILDEDGVFIIQQNYLKSMLKRNAFDNIVHEHLEYYSLHSLNTLLAKHNLEIFDVEEGPVNGGSFRTFIACTGKRKISHSVKNMLRDEDVLKLETKKPYNAFATRVRKNKKKLKTFIQRIVKKGKTVFVYGASTRGNTLLQYFELNNTLLTAAVERNPEKWGKNIASLNIPIISEEEARKKKPDYMLVLPWFFKDEFLKREKSYLRAGGHFIFPLPSFEIV